MCLLVTMREHLAIEPIQFCFFILLFVRVLFLYFSNNMIIQLKMQSFTMVSI
jgi:hypothetical protein